MAIRVLYPVNLKGGEMQGLKAYPSVDEIPDPVDFAVIAIPAQQVADAIRQCFRS
jgi:acetyltransferase